MEPPEPEDSLYKQEANGFQDGNTPWWKRNWLTKQPVLFGTWDGVFTTVMVNIFGVVVFLRMGWIVGTAGVANAILLLLICTALALITVFSAIGIVDRCRIQHGGIYFLVSHVVGGRLGGAVGLIYVLGQAVATALVAVGFGESVVNVFDSESRIAVRIIAVLVLIILTAVNYAGVAWVIRLQLVLLICLAAAVVDFTLGAMFTAEPEHNVYRFSSQRLRLNADPMYGAINCSLIGINRVLPAQSFFTVFGVFFANFLGVLAGVNMSGDLKDPKKSIPVGELSAVGVSSAACFLFIMILGATSERLALVCDSLISEKISLTGVVFMVGLYVCSLSSTIGSLLGTPRVLQGIAAEGIIPLLNPLAQGTGPNNNPQLAAIVLMSVASVFVLIGDFNQLAILSTMPFLITYAFVNYAYVALAMSYDYVTMKEACTDEALPSYGSTNKMSELDQLFPERSLKTETIDNDTEITSQPATWYSLFSSRYIAFIGFLINMLIILLIDIWFAIAHFAVLILLYYYIGRVCPTCTPGVSSFSIPHMFKTAFASFEAIGAFPRGPCVIPQAGPSTDVSTSQLNDPNEDYQSRKPYHHSQPQNITQEMD